jgi:predicted dinucleotide-binding enzyme
MHIRLRGKVPARHRIAVDGRILVDPTCPMVAVQHADRLLDKPVNAGGKRGINYRR